LLLELGYCLIFLKDILCDDAKARRLSEVKKNKTKISPWCSFSFSITFFLLLLFLLASLANYAHDFAFHWEGFLLINFPAWNSYKKPDT